jgi:membrane protein implicated in regulation of membrane protease activity
VKVRIWFWGWLTAAAAIAAVSALLRDRASFPFAIGAGLAAAFEAAGADPALEWLVFAGASFIVFAVANSSRYRPRHLRQGLARHDAEAPRED